MRWFQALLLALVFQINSSDASCGRRRNNNNNVDNAYCGNPPTSCEDTKYTSIDGSCNNLQRPWFGTPGVPYRRLPCLGKITLEDSDDLPNPRTISLQSYVDIKKDDDLWTLLFMQYGQAVAHDISLTQGVPQTAKSPIVCCENGQLTEEEYTNPKCASILLPINDPYNAPQNITCMDFIRVDTTSDVQCTNPPEKPEPLNSETAYLDLSYIYGSTMERAKKVRAFQGGKLASVMKNGHEVLPQDPTPLDTCNVKTATETCFLAGDVRVNQNPQLALIHVMYMQHHNHIAAELAKVNPHWDDERLYQEARKISIALHQCIIYKEYLEGVLGGEYMIKNNISFTNVTGYVNDYDPTLNPAPSNAYATAGFRFFHTEIIRFLKSVRQDRNTSSFVVLDDWYNKPSIIIEDENFEGLTIGLVSQQSSAIDRFHTVAITEFLFKDKVLGKDLKGIDIQRGRDQGVCSYVSVLKFFGLADPKSFKDLTKFIDPANVRILKRLYKNLDKVELTAAAFLERRQSDALSGAAVQAILADQFIRLRRGDRCFFENGQGNCAFTLDQLNEIRRICRITTIFCSVGNVQQMQPNAFKKVSPSNPLKDCSTYPKFDPTAWIETPPS